MYIGYILNLLNEEAAYTNVIVFDLTRPGLKLTIYHTREKHANHYTIEPTPLIRHIDLIYSQYTYIVGKNIIVLYILHWFYFNSQITLSGYFLYTVYDH
jgi:hypothetical protein